MFELEIMISQCHMALYFSASLILTHWFQVSSYLIFLQITQISFLPLVLLHSYRTIFTQT